MEDLKTSIPDAEVRQFFDEHKQEFERVQARHVLIRSPDSRVPIRPGQQALTEDQAKAKAQDICARLTAGGDFAKIAREESDDVGSGQDGGDLGSFGHGKMVQIFEQTAFSLKKGEISKPVRSPFGWHVIQVVERFDTSEKMAEQIRDVIGPRKTTQIIVEMEHSEKPMVDAGFFGPPAPDVSTDPAGATRPQH